MSPKDRETLRYGIWLGVGFWIGSQAIAAIVAVVKLGFSVAVWLLLGAL